MRARNNPYRTERLHSLAFRLAETTWEEILQRLRTLGGRGCVLGPHGSGKTTFLLELAACLRSRGIIVDQYTLRTDDPAISLSTLPLSSSPDRVLILDGADLLQPGQWRRLKRSNGSSLIVSSHEKRLLPTLYRAQPTPVLLEKLMRELHPNSGCAQPAAAELHARHRGNLREALLELYDFHANLPGPGCCSLQEE